jgi:hypothetical protein
MKPWERKLFDWGLLGYLVRDVIGAEQEESFGIRQNHRMYLGDWRQLMSRHFGEHRCELVVPERGWGERIVKRTLGDWRTAKLLGGVLTGMCRKVGHPIVAAAGSQPAMPGLETLLRCPDCHGDLSSNDSALTCQCGYRAVNEGGVYNLLPAKLRADLYPGDRDDAIDFALPGHTARLRDGWYDLEGEFGNHYRWIGPKASAVLRPTTAGPQRLRIRGFAHAAQFEKGQPTIQIRANGTAVTRRSLDRVGLFVIECDLADSPEYLVEIAASPTFTIPDDDRIFSVNLSMLRLLPPGC